MKQLTLQFEGYAGSWQPENVNATKERKERGVSTLVVRTIRTVSEKYADCRSGLCALTDRAIDAISPWHTAWKQWASKRSETFTALCATEKGEVFTNGDVVKAHLWLAVIMALVAVGGAA